MGRKFTSGKQKIMARGQAINVILIIFLFGVN